MVPVVLLIGHQVVPKLIQIAQEKTQKKEIQLQEKKMRSRQGNVIVKKTVFKEDAGARHNDKDG